MSFFSCCLRICHGYKHETSIICYNNLLDCLSFYKPGDKCEKSYTVHWHISGNEIKSGLTIGHEAVGKGCRAGFVSIIYCPLRIISYFLCDCCNCKKPEAKIENIQSTDKKVTDTEMNKV